jgi:transcription-repair coupling factor (superfamily II helicase)
MGEGELEKVMMDFYEKKTNVLVATTIIESGIDVPSANTILIDRADTFGLAQLYQLRGRVGRAQTRAYAYLFIPNEGAVSEDAKKRLEVIQRFVELGESIDLRYKIGENGKFISDAQLLGMVDGKDDRGIARN